MIALWLAAGCRLPTFEGDVVRQGQVALDYTVDRVQVLGVRTLPALALAGEPRTVEALVAGPGGTRHDAVTTYRTCGLSTTASVGVSDLRCFDSPDLVTVLGVGATISWDVPEIDFPSCVPFDGESHPENGEFQGSGCHSVVPILAESVVPDGEVGFGANYVAIPGILIPQTMTFSTEGGEEVVPTEGMLSLSFADPAAPISLTAGEVVDGRVELEVKVEDLQYNRVAWWVDGGDLEQNGRTVLEHPGDGSGYGYNQWVLPSEGRFTVWVVLSEWRDPWGEIPDAYAVLVSQPAWAELTVEVSR